MLVFVIGMIFTYDWYPFCELNLYLYISVNRNNEKEVNMTDILKDSVQIAVYDVLDMYPHSITQIYEKVAETGMNTETSAVMNALVELSMLGFAGQNCGAFYKKV